VDEIVEIASDEECCEIHSKPGGLLEKCSLEAVCCAAKRLDRDGDFRAVRRLKKHFPHFFAPPERSVCHDIVGYDS
jgi:hypothetical protein